MSLDVFIVGIPCIPLSSLLVPTLGLSDTPTSQLIFMSSESTASKLASSPSSIRRVTRQVWDQIATRALPPGSHVVASIPLALNLTQKVYTAAAVRHRTP